MVWMLSAGLDSGTKEQWWRGGTESLWEAAVVEKQAGLQSAIAAVSQELADSSPEAR